MPCMKQTSVSSERRPTPDEPTFGQAMKGGEAAQWRKGTDEDESQGAQSSSKQGKAARKS